MAKPISEIPTEELQKDLADTEEDIKNCSEAIKQGVHTYQGKDHKIYNVLLRRISNREIKAKIEDELKRRERAAENDEDMIEVKKWRESL